MDLQSVVLNNDGRSKLVCRTSCFFANFMRSFLLHSTPSICIDDVSIEKNSSTFKDEEIELRMGMLPLSGIEKLNRVEVGTVLCTGSIECKEGDVRMENATFHNEHVSGSGLICKLRKDESVSITFKVKVGNGSMGSKFCPVVAPTSWPENENEDDIEGLYSVSFETNGTDHEWIILNCLTKMEEKILQMKHSLSVSMTEQK
jgi:hypothetical protein